MKRIIINAERETEMRVALVEDNELFDLSIESDKSNQKKANIYKGRITRVESSLEAVFVDYGEVRQGFLPFKDINLQLYPETQGDFSKLGNLLKVDQELIVQVEKEERGNKGASLTTNISLAGHYLILIVASNDDGRINGISRSISIEERDNIRESMDALNIPDDVRVIVRTSGVGRTSQELQWNLDYLVKLWKMIKQSAKKSEDSTKLLYREGDVIMRTIRDYLREDVEEVVIDNHSSFIKVKEMVNQLMPALTDKIIHYSGTVSIFARYQIEQQVEMVYHKKVSLPSGGELVIDLTEALIAIDVNSSRATSGRDIEETALKTNMEAVREVLRQIRLRDLGGLIVIDFIDMGSMANRKKIEQSFIEQSKVDRARIKVGRISRFGLMEISRQHIGSPLNNVDVKVCQHCGGVHKYRSVDSLSMSIIDIIEEKAETKGVSEIQLQLPIDVATYILNEYRHKLDKIESRHGIKVVAIANEHLIHPNYQIKTFEISDKNLSFSFENKERPQNFERGQRNPKSINKQRAAVEGVLPDTNPPKRVNWLFRLLGIGQKKKKINTKKTKYVKSNNNRRRYPNQRKNRNFDQSRKRFNNK